MLRATADKANAFGVSSLGDGVEQSGQLPFLCHSFFYLFSCHVLINRTTRRHFSIVFLGFFLSLLHNIHKVINVVIIIVDLNDVRSFIARDEIHKGESAIRDPLVDLKLLENCQDFPFLFRWPFFRFSPVSDLRIHSSRSSA